MTWHGQSAGSGRLSEALHWAFGLAGGALRSASRSASRLALSFANSSGDRRRKFVSFVPFGHCNISSKVTRIGSGGNKSTLRGFLSSLTAPTPSLMGMFGRARWDNVRHVLSKSLFPFRVLRRWYQLSILRLLVLEGSAIPLRMGAISRSALWVRRGYKVPSPMGLDELPSSQSQAHRFAYIRYTQKIQAHFPFLSIFDLHLVSQSWRDGWECGVRACIGRNQEEIMRLGPSIDPERGNSMPLSAVQQPTRRDPLNQPPSRE